jgi:hypothetical protein
MNETLVPSRLIDPSLTMPPNFIRYPGLSSANNISEGEKKRSSFELSENKISEAPRADKNKTIKKFCNLFFLF